VFTQQIRERDSLNAAGIPPQSVNGVLTNTASIDMSIFNRLYFDIYQGVGAFAVTWTLMQGNNSSGNDKAALPTTFTGTLNAANGIASVEIRADQLNYRYGTLQINTAGAVLVCVIPRATECRYPPANSYDASFVNARTAN
jgi:hypothetical protein